MKGINEYVTAKDLRALDLIIESGFVFISLTGDPWLQTHKHITGERVQRLLELKLLIPSEDGLFSGTSQTFKPDYERLENDPEIRRLRSARPNP